MRPSVDRILGKAGSLPPGITDAETAYRYAANVIGGPWPDGEALIAQDGYFSELYASSLLGGDWFLQGEPLIAADPSYALCYVQNVIKGPWPEGEAAIAQNGLTAVDYATGTLDAPFPRGEDAIMNNSVSRRIYLEFLAEKWIDVDEHFRDKIASGELDLEELYGTKPMPDNPGDGYL
jgi:lambda repressor-like predicted transcriptional regulator